MDSLPCRNRWRGHILLKVGLFVLAVDDPQAGLSSFAVEITEVNTALRDATQNSLLPIDELGKGTESKRDMLLLQAFWNMYEIKNTRNFCHPLARDFQNPKVDLSNIETWQMEIVENTPTYRVRSGRCPFMGIWSCTKIGDETTSSSTCSRHFWSTYIESSSHVSISIIISRTHVRDSNDLPRFSDEYAWNQHSLSSREMEIPGNKRTKCSLCSSHTATIFYVGETDSFPTRLKAHYQDSQKKNSEGMYVVIPQGKSHARRLENKLISILRTLEFPLLSSADEQKNTLRIVIVILFSRTFTTTPHYIHLLIIANNFFSYTILSFLLMQFPKVLDSLEEAFHRHICLCNAIFKAPHWTCSLSIFCTNSDTKIPNKIWNFLALYIFPTDVKDAIFR